MKLRSNYPARPLSPVPAILLDSFNAEQSLDADDSPETHDEVERQRIYALFEGAKYRALVCGGLEGHDCQAAALLTAIGELDQFLDGSMTERGLQGLYRKLDADELGILQIVRRTMVQLLHWHFQNGAGALLPIAKNLGLVVETTA